MPTNLVPGTPCSVFTVLLFFFFFLFSYGGAGWQNRNYLEQNKKVPPDGTDLEPSPNVGTNRGPSCALSFVCSAALTPSHRTPRGCRCSEEPTNACASPPTSRPPRRERAPQTPSPVLRGTRACRRHPGGTGAVRMRLGCGQHSALPTARVPPVPDSNNASQGSPAPCSGTTKVSDRSDASTLRSSSKTWPSLRADRWPRRTRSRARVPPRPSRHAACLSRTGTTPEPDTVLRGTRAAGATPGYSPTQIGSAGTICLYRSPLTARGER